MEGLHCSPDPTPAEPPLAQDGVRLTTGGFLVSPKLTSGFPKEAESRFWAYLEGTFKQRSDGRRAWRGAAQSPGGAEKWVAVLARGWSVAPASERLLLQAPVTRGDVVVLGVLLTAM